MDLDFTRVRERVYDIAGSLNWVADSDGRLDRPRLIDAYESTADKPLTAAERQWLPGALALVPLHWAATAGHMGTIAGAETAMIAAEAWWARREEVLSW